MSAAINPKGPHVYTKDSGPLGWATKYLASTVGQKILVALTGLGLSGFVLFHMIGNLKVFGGPEGLNKYAHFLKHELGALLWIARGGLLAIFLLHIGLTLRLKAKSAAARPVGYSFRRTVQATFISKTMLYTGLVILFFTVFHLAHFTFMLGFTVVDETGKVVPYNELTYTPPGGQPMPDVYRMVIAGFSVPWISALYAVGQIALFLHLSHGVMSALRTLGLVGVRSMPAAKILAYSVAVIVAGANLAMVAAVQFGLLK